MSYTVKDLDDGVQKWAFEAYTEAQKTDDYVEYLDDEYESWDDIGDDTAWKSLNEELYVYGGAAPETAFIPGIGDMIKVSQQGGGEGGGEDYHVVVRVTGQDGTVRTFKRNGWYASFDGGYLEGPTVEGKIVVKAVEVFE